jgi:hypothetical protein
MSGIRPTASDHAPAGSFSNAPVIVEAATTTPTVGAVAPSSRARSGNNGDRHIA